MWLMISDGSATKACVPLDIIQIFLTSQIGDTDYSRNLQVSSLSVILSLRQNPTC